MNSVVFNIFGVRNQYSSQELLMYISYEKAGFIYTIFGILDITKQFVKKVCPKYFTNEEQQEFFEDTV